MTDADDLAWHIEWRRKIRSAMRLWLGAKGYRDGCDRLADLKHILNEQPPITAQINAETTTEEDSING